MERSKNVKKMIVISMMSAIGFILMALIEIPVPGFPPFLKIDISDITSLVTMILYGPVAGILVSFFKNFLYYMVRGGTAGIPVGEFANLLASIMLVLPTYYMWKKSQTLKGLVTGMVISTLLMTIVLSGANYLFIYPLYEKLVGLNVPNLRSFIVTFILPFNVLKGLLVTFVFSAVYISLKSWIQVKLVNKRV